MEIISPLTGNNQVKLELEIPVSKIIKIYKNNLDIDVTACFHDNDVVSIYECLTTGYRFYSPKTIAGNDTFYEELIKRSGSYYKFRQEYGLALKYINSNDKILDVGCGSGVFLSTVKNKGITSNCFGLEFNDKAIQMAKNQFGFELNKDTIQEHSIKNKNAYDVVSSFQVLEHIYDVKSFIESCLLCLKTNGILIIAVPNNNPYLYKYDVYHCLNLPPHHMGLWSVSAFKNLTKIFSNLELIHVQTTALEFGERGYYVSQLIENSLGKKLPKVIKKALKAFEFVPLPFDGRNILAVFKKR